MVFCGIGSKACSSCRTRRIKCDQVSPACSQCLRAGKECTGYRDPVSMMFRDENEKVIDKASRKVRSSKDTNGYRKAITDRTKPSSSSAGTPSTSNDEVENSEPISVVPGTPLASLALTDTGIKFFFENFVTDIPCKSPSELDLTSSLLWRELVTNKTFSNAASSVGFAALSNVKKDPTLMVIARQKYLTTIKDVATALADPSKADLFATFKSVMVLAAFEVVNCTSNDSWGVHIDGGQAIIKLTSSSHPELPGPVRMQMQFIFSVCIKCISRGEKPPESLLVLNEQCKESLAPDDLHAASLVEITYRLLEFYANITTAQNKEPSVILEEALLLDHELENWESHLPERWRFKTTTAADDLDYRYNGQTQECVDLWCARVYNNYRWARIIVNQLIIVHMVKLGSSSSENTTQRTKSSNVISHIATDVCSSVSSHLRRYSAQEAVRYAVPPLSGVFLTLFAIAVGGSAMEVSDDLHNWTINTLEKIGNRMGIARALILTPLMKRQRENWKKGRTGFLLIGTNLHSAM